MSKNIKKFKRFNSSKQYLSNPKKNSQIEEINSFINKNQSYTKLFSNSVIKNYTPLSQKDKLNMFQNINENSKNRFLEYNKLFDNIKNEIIDINKSIISYDNYSPKNSSLIIEPFSLNSSSKKINININKNNNNNSNNNINNNINNINNLKGNFQSIIERPEEQFSSPYILFTKEKNKIKKKKRKNSNKKRAKSPHIRYDSNNLDLDINLSSLNENKEEIITEPTSRKNYNENQNYSNSNNNNIISLNSSHGSSSMKNLNLKRNVFIQKYNNINNLNGNKFFNNLYYQKDVEFYYEPTLEKNNFNECYYYCDNDCICF
jgi:hypothetical protein